MSKPKAMLYQQNSQHVRVMNLKYQAKCRRLKRLIKGIIIENAALCDEVADVQAELTVARDHRRFLIKRLLRHEGLDNLEQQDDEATNEAAGTNANVVSTNTTISASTIASPVTAATARKPVKPPKQRREPKEPKVPKKRGPKKRLPCAGLAEKPGAGTSFASEKGRGKQRDTVKLDECGKPLFPINLCNILIHSQGEIIPGNPNFHAAHWIYPVGYVTTRIYAHPKDPQRKCVFTCKILNNAGMPQFQIIPDNDLDSVFFGESANICHQALLEALQRSLTNAVELPLHVQGEKFFGLGNPTVKSLLQLDAGLKQCANFRGFIAPESNFAVMEERDPTLCFEALQSLVKMSAYRMPEVKEEPPDELLEVLY